MNSGTCCESKQHFSLEARVHIRNTLRSGIFYEEKKRRKLF